jgi:cytoskeletal protein RodZ
MDTKSEEIERLSPERLMRMFSHSPIVLAWMLSIVIHLLLGAATSWEYAYNRYVKPEQEPQAAGDTNITASATGTVAGATGTVVSATGTVSSAAATSGVSTTVVATNEPPVDGSREHEAAMLKKYSNSPTVQAITAVATSNEIPKAPPDDIGISIKDTNPF